MSLTRRQPAPDSDLSPEHLLAQEIKGALVNFNDAYQQMLNGVKTLRAIPQIGADPKVIPTNTDPARAYPQGMSGPITLSPGRLAGWSLRETSGAATATVRLLDGPDKGGALLAAVALAAGGTANQWLMPGGASYGAGVYVDITGSVEGVVYLGGILK